MIPEEAKEFSSLLINSSTSTRFCSSLFKICAYTHTELVSKSFTGTIQIQLICSILSQTGSNLLQNAEKYIAHHSLEMIIVLICQNVLHLTTALDYFNNSAIILLS